MPERPEFRNEWKPSTGVEWDANCFVERENIETKRCKKESLVGDETIETIRAFKTSHADPRVRSSSQLPEPLKHWDDVHRRCTIPAQSPKRAPKCCKRSGDDADIRASRCHDEEKIEVIRAFTFKPTIRGAARIRRSSRIPKPTTHWSDVHGGVGSSGRRRVRTATGPDAAFGTSSKTSKAF